MVEQTSQGASGTYGHSSDTGADTISAPRHSSTWVPFIVKRMSTCHQERLPVTGVGRPGIVQPAGVVGRIEPSGSNSFARAGGGSWDAVDVLDSRERYVCSRKFML